VGPKVASVLMIDCIIIDGCHDAAIKGMLMMQDEASRRIVERMEDCTRKFRETLILGGAGMHVLEALLKSSTGVEKVVIADSSRDMIDRNKKIWQKWVDSGRGGSVDLSFHLFDCNSPEEDMNLQDSSFDGML